jgi:hypothetical protein
MGFGCFEGKKSFQEVWGYLLNFEWLQSFGAKEKGPLQSLGFFSGIFGVFGAVYDLIINSF